MSLAIQQTKMEVINDFMTLKGYMTEMTTSAHALVIATQESYDEAMTLWNVAKKIKKSIEFQRKAANEPDQHRINARNDKAKEITKEIDVIESLVKQKTEGYLQELEAQKQEEAKMADAVGLTLTPQELEVGTVRGTGAYAYKVKKTRFRVTDLAKVPHKYLMLNEEVVELDIKMGIQNIPGIEVYEEEVTKIRSR